MQPFFNFIRRRWVRGLFGVLVLSVVIWFFGPLLAIGSVHLFDSVPVRILAIVAMFTLFLVLTLWRQLRHAKRDKALAEDVTKTPQQDAAAAGSEEVAELTGRLRTALADLKRVKIGGRRGRRLYQLPWYMFIGPPGAGKTTALANSGLRFPLAETHGPHAIGGVGGTRNCDWWFTDEAVLIDTAGRYTTQDSDTAADAAAWLGFLHLLKKHRRRQPLNGVLLAISLSDLSELTEAERQAHAAAMRRRVRELQEQLGVRIPIYVLFTKADLMAGFVEFFDGLDREQREQVWGMTFPLDTEKSAKAAAQAMPDGGPIAAFGVEFDLLLDRLNDRMLERLDQEGDVQRRRLIYGFPQQVASLRETAREFLEAIFRPSRLEARPLLRGVYFTSGTQDGTPIDRLLGAMASQFGLARQQVGAFSGAGRSYFLSRLMREVVFPEAGLVSKDARLERRVLLTHIAAYSAAAFVVLGLTAAWTISYIGNLQRIARVEGQARDYQVQYKALTDRGPNDIDLPPVLPPLNTLRATTGGYTERAAPTPFTLTFGLYQGQKLSVAAVDAYYRGLNGILLPRLLARLEGELRANLDKSDQLYELLKVYLILGRQGPLDRGLVTQWLQADLERDFPSDEDAAGRDALMDHATALMERPLASPPLDGALITQVREILTREPLAEYSYRRIMRSRRIRELPLWTVADNAGPGASQVFLLRSGRKLATGVPGIFTYAGYHSLLLPILPTVTQDIAEDGWVLGREDRGVQAKLEETAHLRRDVLGLYLDDYVRQWDSLIADIALKPFTDLQQGLDELNLLSAPDSPLRDLLTALQAQTQLSHPTAAGNATGAAQAALIKAGKRAAGFAGLEARIGLSRQEGEIASVLSESFGTNSATGKPIDPASHVDQHFQWLRDFVEGRNGDPSGLEIAIQKIGVLYGNFSQVSSSANAGQALLGVVKSNSGGASGSPAAQLQDLSKDLPKSVASMLQTVSASSTAVTSSGATQQLSDAWRSKVLPLCQAAFDRYPFVATSDQDVPMDDFIHLLGPGGLMDGFFNDNLASLVDTTQTPWRWQAGGNVALGLADGTLAEFQRAAAIRDAMFAGGTQVQVKFELAPVSLDTALKRVSIEIAGQTMTYDHGPVEAMSFTWPANGHTLSRVTITPESGHETVIEKDGPWALLRLLDRAALTPTSAPDRFGLAFKSAQGTASFILNASSVRNPFTMDALRSFRCPAKL